MRSTREVAVDIPEIEGPVEDDVAVQRLVDEGGTWLEVREAMSGNLCRCTGYQNVVDAVCAAGQILATQRATPAGTATAQV